MIKNIDGFPGYAITEDAKVYHNGKEIKPSGTVTWNKLNTLVFINEIKALSKL